MRVFDEIREVRVWCKTCGKAAQIVLGWGQNMPRVECCGKKMTHDPPYEWTQKEFDRVYG